MGSNRTISVNPDSLRRMRPESEEADTQMLGAAEALRAALQQARMACPDLPSLDPQLCDDVALHYQRCRVVADEFDLVAEGFVSSQRGGLPSVFSRKLPSYVGPWADLNTDGNRKWIDERLRAAREAGDAKVRGVATAIRRQLGLVEARPFPVGRQVFQAGFEVGAGVSVGAEVEWELEELSNGVTTLTLRKFNSVALGRELEASLAWGDRRVGPKLLAELGFSVKGGEGWAKTFPSRSQAESFMADHLAKGVAENLHVPVPLVGLFRDKVADFANASGMRDAHVEETILGGEASGSFKSKLDKALRGADALASAGLTASAMVTEERDSRGKTETDRLAIVGALSVELVAGRALSLGPSVVAEATVTRDSTRENKGQARSMTLRLAFDDKAGKIPELLGRPQPAAGGVAGNDTHRYEVQVDVDLTDVRNAALQNELSTRSGLEGRLDEDANALAQLVNLDRDLLARSAVSVIEQAPLPSAEYGVALSAVALGAEAGVTRSGYRTVEAWQKVGGEAYRQVDLRP
jgi:hypothetical protein